MAEKISDYEKRHRTDTARGQKDEGIVEARRKREKGTDVGENHFARDMMSSTIEWSKSNMSTGGGQPIEKGHRRTTQERVLQPRDPEGRFDYNSAAGMSQKYPTHSERNGSAEKGWGNKQKVPLFARGLKVNFALDEKGNEVIKSGTVIETDSGTRFRSCEDISRKEFEDMLRDYWVDKSGEGHLGNDVLFARVKGRRREKEETYVSDISKLAGSTQKESAQRAGEYLDQANIVGPKGGKRGRDDFKYRNIDLGATDLAGADIQPWVSGKGEMGDRISETIHRNYGHNAKADAMDCIKEAKLRYPNDKKEAKKAAEDLFYENGMYREISQAVFDAIQDSDNNTLKNYLSKSDYVRDALFQAARGRDLMDLNGNAVKTNPDFFDGVEYWMTLATGREFEDSDLAAMFAGGPFRSLWRTIKNGPQKKKQSAFVRRRRFDGGVTEVKNESEKRTPYSTEGNLVDQFGYSRQGYDDIHAEKEANNAFGRVSTGRANDDDQAVVEYINDKFGNEDPMEFNSKFRGRFIQYYKMFMKDKLWKKYPRSRKENIQEKEQSDSEEDKEMMRDLFDIKDKDRGFYPKGRV